MRIGGTWIGAGMVMLAASAIAQTPHASSSGAPEASAAPSAKAAALPDAPTGSADAGARAPARPSPYSANVLKGHAAMAAHNVAAAVDAYRAATTADARDALAWYFLAEAELAAGDFEQADAALTSGLGAAGTNDDVHARLLFTVADLRERQGRWSDAKRAWEAYGEFASSHPNAKSYAVTAAERAKIIGTHVDLEAKYGAVKQRAEQRAKEAGPPAAVGSAERTPASPPKKK